MKKFRITRARKAGICVFLLLTLAIGLMLLDHAVHIQREPLPYPKAQEVMPEPKQSDTNEVSEDFATHLPLVVLDLGNQTPRSDSVWDVDKGYQVPVDFDPYVRGTMKLIAHENDVNRLSDVATLETDLKVRLRGNSSADFDKKQYLLKLYHPDGSKNEQDILGLGQDWEWVLNISLLDKSLLRNYVAFTMGKQTEVLSPDARYCEVLCQRGERLEYLGVYLLSENVERSPSRVDIPAYSPTNDNFSYIIRRDRLDGVGAMLPTDSHKNKRLYGALELKYPKEEVISTQHFNRVVAELDTIENILLSDNPEEYLQYSQKINTDSFVDYFILNELLMNYDAGFRSTYSYKGYDGKLTMGPFWDFDQSFDNDPLGGASFDQVAMQEAPWFRQLLRDPAYVKKVIARYHDLRETVFSNDAVSALIDGTVAYLGPAVQRDWSRWGYHYRTPYLKQSDKDTANRHANRNVQTYEAEIARMKTAYQRHADWLDVHIEDIYQFCDSKIPTKEEAHFVQRYGDVFALLFIGVFLIAIILIRREA